MLQLECYNNSFQPIPAQALKVGSMIMSNDISNSRLAKLKVKVSQNLSSSLRVIFFCMDMDTQCEYTQGLTGFIQGMHYDFDSFGAYNVQQYNPTSNSPPSPIP